MGRSVRYDFASCGKVAKVAKDRQLNSNIATWHTHQSGDLGDLARFPGDFARFAHAANIATTPQVAILTPPQSDRG